MAELTHFDGAGNAVMVDVSAKEVTARTAVATATIRMAPATLALILAGAVAKGDVFAVARLAGIMAAKRTSELIPLCHVLSLTAVTVDFAVDEGASTVTLTAECRTRDRTGVEMEALTAAAVAALTLYDMCKAVDRGMMVSDLRLLHKTGGRSGTFAADGGETGGP